MKQKIDFINSILPGFVLTIVLALVARFIYYSISEQMALVFGEIVFGLGVGCLIINIFKVNAIFFSGIDFCMNKLLKIAIVLLGMQKLPDGILHYGFEIFIIILVNIILAFLIASLMGFLLNVSRKMTTLVACGIAICGNTAILAVAPVILAKNEELSFAVAINTLFGFFAVFCYPIIGHYFNFSDLLFGAWVGTAINDTSQVVATGFSYNDNAGEIATAVKLIRNSLIGVVIVVMSYVFNESPNENRKNIRFMSILSKIPLFVVIFVLVNFLNTLGFFSWVSDQLFYQVGYSSLLRDVKLVTKFMMLMVLTSVGLSVKINMIKLVGFSSVFISFTTAFVLSAFSLLNIYFFVIK